MRHQSPATAGRRAASRVSRCWRRLCEGTTSNAGCVATLTTTNPAVAPVSGAGDYAVFAVDLSGFKNGIFFFGINGNAAATTSRAVAAFFIKFSITASTVT